MNNKNPLYRIIRTRQDIIYQEEMSEQEAEKKMFEYADKTNDKNNRFAYEKVNEEITKEQFKAFEKVRSSGVTNMYNVPMVINLSNLTREQITNIMNDYDELMEKYPEVRKWIWFKEF